MSPALADILSPLIIEIVPDDPVNDDPVVISIDPLEDREDDIAAAAAVDDDPIDTPEDPINERTLAVDEDDDDDDFDSNISTSSSDIPLDINIDPPDDPPLPPVIDIDPDFDSDITDDSRFDPADSMILPASPIDTSPVAISIDPDRSKFFDDDDD
jgi:hypothetical protein